MIIRLINFHCLVKYDNTALRSDIFIFKQHVQINNLNFYDLLFLVEIQQK